MIHRNQTEWVPLQVGGTTIRGKQLRLRATGEYIGSVEPFRGRRTLWLAVQDLPPCVEGKKGTVRIYTQKATCLLTARRKICDLWQNKDQLLAAAMAEAGHE